MVKKLHSTQKSKGFFASESGENYWHCSVPLSQVTKQHSEVGIGAQLECRKMQGLNQGTRSFPDCKFPGNSRFAGNTSSLGFTVLSSQYTPIKILRDLSLILAKQHQIVINSKCFTSANLLFFLQFKWAAAFYSSDLEYSTAPWKCGIQKCAHLHNQISFQELQGHRLQWTFHSKNV